MSKQKEILLGGVNFSLEFAKKVSRKRFDELVKVEKPEAKDNLWKRLETFADRTEKKATSKKKKKATAEE